MRELLTNLLDALGLLLVAAGVGAFTYRWIGWAALAVAGVVVLTGSQVSAWQARPAKPAAKPAGRIAI